MTDYLTINGSQINMVTWDVALDRCTPYTRGGISELEFSRIVGALAALPDPWSGLSCSWSNGSSYPGTTYFSGTIVGYTDRYDSELGWVRDYRALGLENLGTYVPVTDSNTLSDSAQFNMPSNAINSLPSRMGRTCGQAVLDVLSMSENAAALQAYGIGNYTSTGSGATASATMTVGNTLATYGTISGLVLGTGGSGYGTTPPSVTIVGPCTTQAVYTANLTAGSVSSFTQVSAGAGYTTPPAVIISTLPSVTITDLAALTVIPPFVMTFCGERLLQSVESIIQSCHPNHWLWVDPTGNIRVFDQRVTTDYTVTLGKPASGGAEPDGTYGNRWMMPQLHRDLSDTYSQLIVRGDTDISGITLSVLPTAATGTIVYNSALTGGVNVNTGGLYPDFAYGSYTTSAAAAAAYDPHSFVTQSLQGGQDQGSCTCSSTTSVVIQSFNTSLVLTSDQLDQSSSGLHAVLTVSQAFGSGIAQMFSTSVIANTSTTSGASTLTVSPPLPATTYTSYFLTFSSQMGNVVYRRYIATQAGVGALLQNYFPYPFAYRNVDGTAAALTSAATGMVLWSASGSAPYQESDFSITVDPESGTISFPRPTALVYGGGVVTPPSNVMAFVPIATGDLTITVPSVGSYAGTLYSVEGIERTKTITLRDWTEYGTNANIPIFAAEQFDAIKDVVVEGSINYLGLATTYLTPGASVSITGQGYTTGWETLQTSPMPAGLPVASVDVTFNWGGQGSSYITTLHLTNRKAKYTGEVFTRPPTTGQALGGAFGAGHAEAWGKGIAGLTGSEHNAAADGLDEIGLFEGLDEIDGGGGAGGGGGRKSPRVAMPTHPEAGLGQAASPSGGPASSSGSSSRSWDAPDESWEQPVSATGPPPAAGNSRGVDLMAPPPGATRVTDPTNPEHYMESYGPPAPAAAAAAAATPSGQPSSPAEWLKHYQDKQAMPNEAQGVIDAERQAAQQAGQSVTGKPYVPTLDEALDNPINKPPPSAADLDRIDKESQATPEAQAQSAKNRAAVEKMRAEGGVPQ